jgi:hypothetical protein
MNKQTLIRNLSDFLQADQLEKPDVAKKIATRFADSVEDLLDDDHTYGELNWTPPDIIQQAEDVYGLTVTRAQAIEMFENELNRMKFISDMSYGWSLIDAAIEQRFNVEAI